jgi:hypothetical protein
MLKLRPAEEPGEIPKFICISDHLIHLFLHNNNLLYFSPKNGRIREVVIAIKN